MSAQNNNTLTFAYNSNSLLIVYNNQVSFLSIVPLAQQRNAEIADVDTLNAFKEYKKTLINQVQAYDTGTLTRKGTLGPMYKIISLYNKLSPLQRFQVERGVNELNFFNKDNIKKEQHYFNAEKKKYIINECLSYNEYNKEDFLIIQTYISNLQVRKFVPEKKNIKTFFEEINNENYGEYKTYIDQMYLTHRKNVLDNFANDSYNNISPHNILEILSKLSLNQNIVYLNEMNALDINLFKSYNDKQQNWQIDVKINEADNKPFVFIINKSSLTMYSNVENGSKIIKIFEGQEVLYYWNKEKTIFTIEIKEGETITPIKKFFSPFKVEEGYEKKYKYDFTLAEVPLNFNKNMVKLISNSLKTLGFDVFSIITEIQKKPSIVLEKQITTSKKIYTLLSQIPSFNDALYNKELVKKKIEAFNSIIFHITEGGREFSTTRFSFSLTLPYTVEEDMITFQINQILSTFSIRFKMLKGITTHITDPIPYKAYIQVSENIMELENSEVEELIDLEYGNKYFNMLEDNSVSSLTQLDNAHIYLKTDSKIQSLNIFEGPDMFNGLIIAPSGSGKSFLTVNLINGFLSSNPENLCWILDRGGSYVNFTETFGGNNINLKKSDEKNCINPFVFDNYFSKLIYIEELLHFASQLERKIERLEKNLKGSPNNKEILKEIEDLKLEKTKSIEKVEKLIKVTKFRGRDEVLRDYNDLPEKTNFKDLSPQDIIEIFNILVETMIKVKNLDDKEQRLVKKSINKAIIYLIVEDLKGIDNFDHLKDNDEINYLLIEDIANKIQENLLKEGLEAQTVKSIISSLDSFIDPMQSGKLFNGKPALNLSSLLVNIDFGEIQEEALADLVLSALLLNFFNVMTSDKYKFSKKLLIIDEAHAVLNGSEISGLKSVSYLYRTARKHGGAVWLLSQGINDFVKLQGEVAPERMALFGGIVENAGWKVLLGKHLKKNLIDRLDMNNTTAVRISEKPDNSREFYILTAKVSGFASLVVSDLHYAIATTNKEEKNILKSLDLLTNDTQNSLLIFATIFGKNFIRKYASVQGLKDNYGSSVDMQVFHDKLNILFEDYDDELKERIISKIEKTQKITIEILNAILVKAEIESKITKVKDVVSNSKEKHINLLAKK